MIELHRNTRQLTLSYSSNFRTDWVVDELKKQQEVTVAKVFHFRTKDLIGGLPDEPEEFGRVKFVLGVADGGYYKINSRKLDANFDVYIDKKFKLERKHFIVHNNISVFKKIDKIVRGPIIIGGEENPSIPIDDFEKLIETFPTSYELEKYSLARVEMAIREHLSVSTDAERKYEKYLEKRSSSTRDRVLTSIREPEKEKFILLRDQLLQMLKDANAYSESKWQAEILQIITLIYPKYIAALEDVEVKDEIYDTKRKIDLALVDASGNLDIIEIKKPFDSCLMSSSKYRDNFVPKRELSGSIMQCEKYIYHLSKSGKKGEDAINLKHKSKVPGGVPIRIINPTALIIAGRDNNLDDNQKIDFEFARRKYKNIIDLVTYDDLIDRLERIITKYS